LLTANISPATVWWLRGINLIDINKYWNMKVIAFYEQDVDLFPSFKSLSEALSDTIVKLWYADWSDLAEKLVNLECEIDILEILAHGTSHYINGFASDNDVHEFCAALFQAKSLVKKSTIVISSCDSGVSVIGENRCIASVFAAYSGCVIFGANGLVRGSFLNQSASTVKSNFQGESRLNHPDCWNRY
jgi:hypothetical protein